MENLSCLTFVQPLSMPWTDNYFILCVFCCIKVSEITKNIWQICPCVILHSFVHSKNTLIWHQLWPRTMASNRDTEESEISSLASSCSQMKGWDDKQIMTNKHVGQASQWGALAVVREVMSDRTYCLNRDVKGELNFSRQSGRGSWFQPWEKRMRF